MLLNIIVPIITITITHNIKSVTSKKYVCADYEKCKKYTPDHEYMLCKEILEAWKSTYTCLAKSNCNDGLHGAGVILGRCLGYGDYYKYMKDCDTALPIFKDMRDVCGITAIPKFDIEFINNNRTSERNCHYPKKDLGCQRRQMSEFITCIMRIAANSFTKGMMQGGCEVYSSRGTQCNFGEMCSNSEYWTATFMHVIHCVLLAYWLS